jgi:alkanesulfonate monooxygenase SsuD/methylene tetrahydromethanopterin reductase-like flavin-dependent oxidoreductase (luciferase family)
MDVGVHLPQVSATADRVDVDRVFDVVDAARRLGFAAVSANDHLAFHLPWLDGPTLLAAVARGTGSMELATTVVLSAVRGPVQVASMLGTLSAIAPGRVLTGVGAGSSEVDHALVGLSFEERWARFEESVVVLRSLVRGDPLPPEWDDRLGSATPTSSASPSPIPVWVASWGSLAGLRRVARLGDGWLASAYNTTPEQLTAGRELLHGALRSAGREAAGFPIALATAWTYLTDSEEEARARLDALADVLGRDPARLAGQVLIGGAAHCTALLGRYAEAGVDAVFIWPLGDPVAQLQRFGAEVLPGLG